MQKHYWGATIVAHGFRALYADSDAIFVKNPLPWFNPAYDVQASGNAAMLSWNGSLRTATLLTSVAAFLCNTGA